ncbi:hypothetical protein [Streptomyces griseorubiginosus]
MNVDVVLVGDDGRWDIDVTCVVSADRQRQVETEVWQRLGFVSGVSV